MNFAALRAIARHRFLMLIIAEQEITLRIEAERTLRDGQMLQEVSVDKKSLRCIDKWIEYADEAIEEADRVEIKCVHWAEETRVEMVEQYINVPGALYNPMEDEDSEQDDLDGKYMYGEDYLADNEAQFKESCERSTLQTDSDSCFPIVPGKPEEEFALPFPSPTATDITSTVDDNQSAVPCSDEPQDYLARMEALRATLDCLRSLRQSRRYQGTNSAATSEEPQPRRNRFRR